ncbi:Transmembrane protein 230/134 [Dillenia turbinata]|uniref:Transmembrane protein 230/134 n=1 Tax=Dillenia turbinata TaxID=194707 RepID=A0AAN8UMJ6_9MAGN
MGTRRNIRYTPLNTDDDDYDGKEYDRRFDYTPKSFDKIPWKSIVLALFLLCLGSFLLFLAFFILTGHMGGEKSQAYGLLGLGVLTFLPEVVFFAVYMILLARMRGEGGDAEAVESMVAWEKVDGDGNGGAGSGCQFGSPQPKDSPRANEQTNCAEG